MNRSILTHRTCIEKSPARKRYRRDQEIKTQEHLIPLRSVRNEPCIINDLNDTVKEVEKDLHEWKRRKQQSLCVELASFLFDMFCQMVILPSCTKLDWFLVVRDLVHREYMNEELAQREREVVESIKQQAALNYFTDNQWYCLLNLNVSMGQPCGHQKMNPDQLCAEVKNLADEWLDGDAQQTVKVLVEAMENFRKLENNK